MTLFVSTGPSTEKTAVPNVIYDSEETARQKIEAAGLKVGNIEPRYSNQDAGIVIETDPLPTTMVSEGSTVQPGRQQRSGACKNIIRYGDDKSPR